jgi:hypothetical protein
MDMKVIDQISDAEQQCRAGRPTMSIDEYSDGYGPGQTKTVEEIKSRRLRAREFGRRTIITEGDADDGLRRLPAIQAVGEGAP